LVQDDIKNRKLGKFKAEGYFYR